LALAALFGVAAFSAVAGAYVVILTGLENASAQGSWHACRDFNCLIDWIDHWQTLLAGMGALLAAGVSIYYLRQQIAQSAAQETGRRARRLAAARARLQLALSQTSHYATEMLSLLRGCLDAIGARDQLPTAIANQPRPNLPDAAIQSFEAVIEATDDDEFAALIADMISEMQVLDARVSGLPVEHESIGRLNIQSYLLNAAQVYGYASSVFEYARRETEQPPHNLDWDAVVSALNIAGMYQDQDAYADLHAFLGRARDRALSAGQA
jgi:hypothetical protein